MKVEITGANDFNLKLAKLGEDTTPIVKRALYMGAKIMADNIKSQIQGLSTTDNWRNLVAYNAGGEAALSKEQKEGLVSGFGLSKMKYANGETYLVMGFSGYNTVKTKRWPNGQPNLMIAAVVEQGTSFFQAQPFYKRAVQESKASVNDAIQQELDRAVTEIMK